MADRVSQGVVQAAELPTAAELRVSQGAVIASELPTTAQLRVGQGAVLACELPTTAALRVAQGVLLVVQSALLFESSKPSPFLPPGPPGPFVTFPPRGKRIARRLLR